MKIDTEQISGLTRTQARTQPKVGLEDGGFGELLAREVDKSAQGGASEKNKPSVPIAQGGVLGLDMLFQAVNVAGVAKEKPSETSVMNSINSVVGDLEKYVAGLAESDEKWNAKNAYSVLENIEGGVKKIKEQYEGLPQKSQELGSIINELEVMTAAERFKFNRGDYI